MIKYNNKFWFRFLFATSGYYAEGMFLSLIAYGFLVVLLILTYQQFSFSIFDLPSTFHTVLGLVIGLLLVFRTNTAYDRWWEGRKQLGALVNTCRHLSIKAKHYLKNDEVFDLVALFPFILKIHLRDGNYEKITKDVPEHLLEGFVKANHKPGYILNRLSSICYEAFKNGAITGEQLIVLEDEISLLTDILGACERIRNTPIPFGYAVHLKRILLVYLITLPFGFIKTMGWYSVPFMLIVFYTMIGIELVGEEIEEPFGTDINDLPFDELEQKIKQNIIEIKGF